MTYVLVSKKSEVRGTLYVALSGMLFGLIGFLGTQLVHLHFSVDNMLFWRFFIATLWMYFYHRLMRKPYFFDFPADHIKKPVHFNALIKIFIFGAVSYSGSSAFYFLATQYIGTGLAMVVFFSFPVFVMLFAWISGNWRMSKHAIVSLLIVIIGLIFLKGQGNHALHSSGIFLAMLGALCFAAYVVGSQHTIKQLDSRLLTLFVCLGNTIIFLFFSFYNKSFLFPTSFHAWFYICAIGIFATALPIQLLLTGLKYTSPIKASILSVLEPVVTLVIGSLFLHEIISRVQFIGIFIVLLGAVLIQFEKVPNTAASSQAIP